VDTPLVGRHQLRNIALAVATAEELHEQGFEQITAESIERGIRDTRWPGRFQSCRRTMASQSMCSTWPTTRREHGSAVTLSRHMKTGHHHGFRRHADKAIEEMAEILFPIAGM